MKRIARACLIWLARRRRTRLSGIPADRVTRAGGIPAVRPPHRVFGSAECQRRRIHSLFAPPIWRAFVKVAEGARTLDRLHGNRPDCRSDPRRSIPETPSRRLATIGLARPSSPPRDDRTVRQRRGPNMWIATFAITGTATSKTSHSWRGIVPIGKGPAMLWRRPERPGDLRPHDRSPSKATRPR
jgi:hypothetical protein